MDYFFEGIKQGLFLLLHPKKEIIEIIILSLLVSGSATLLSVIFALPISLCLAIKEFRLKRFIVSVINTWMSVPAVLIGLFVYILITRQGPLGKFHLLYTPYAIVIAQTVLATPIITALSFSSIKVFAKDVKDISYSLGADKFQTFFLIIKESKAGLIIASITAFSRIIGETGMTLMVGGNIKGLTRVMTTAIALETMKGNFEFGIAIGMILFLIALIINIILQFFQGKQ